MKVNWNDKESILQALNEKVHVFQHIFDELKDNKEFVFQMVKQSGDSLEHASKRLQNDKESVLESIKLGNSGVCTPVYSSIFEKKKYSWSIYSSILL
jgi:intergrase/recombinase